MRSVSASANVARRELGSIGFGHESTQLERVRSRSDAGRSSFDRDRTRVDRASIAIGRGSIEFRSRSDTDRSNFGRDLARDRSNSRHFRRVSPSSDGRGVGRPTSGGRKASSWPSIATPRGSRRQPAAVEPSRCGDRTLRRR
ncbi:hypothetical protein DB32_006748 [Sandaracinus amylolyticus]|uniref:Uncharacterized protein n=1 Tax=Sandaracinus amylolyticus TaxID=927083 RepID=A0A0F6SH04_9BACT|nr:hypothetical protein DB32_006748 [Sandaracinus amylolyticus]